MQNLYNDLHVVLKNDKLKELTGITRIFKVVWVLMFGSTEISKKYIYYAKFREEFKSEIKIWGNSAGTKVMEKLRKGSISSFIQFVLSKYVITLYNYIIGCYEC